MVWPDIEPPQHQHAAANDWELEPHSLRYAFPPPLASGTPSRPAHGDMASRPPNASDFNASASGTHTGGLTYSASCPSFTALYELSSDDDLMRDLQASGTHPHAPLPMQTSRVSGFVPSAMPSAAGLLQPAPLLQNSHGIQDHDLALPPPPFATDKSYDVLLEMQQEHLDPSMRQFPHQQAHFHATGGMDHFALFSQPRRPLHASASFTSLSSMETEYRRQSASKRKKAGAERWHKMQRHKSWTSPATSMELSTYSGAGSSQFASTPEHNFLDEVPDADMIGFSIDDFPSNFTPDASWPVALTLGGGIPFDAYVAGGAASAHTSDAGDPSVSGSASAAAATDLLDLDTVATSAALDAADASERQQTPSDIDLLLSDHERANMSSLFDAIRDFEAPAAPEPAPVATTAPASTTSSVTKPMQRRAAGAKKRTHSPPLHPSKPQASTLDKRTAASASPLALPPPAPESPASASPPVPSVRERLETALARAHGRDVARAPLTDTERVYLETSPLFAPARVSETAGSLWLILHAARCEFGCEIAGCSVMRRVVRHCLSCDAVVGRCKDPCNEAKTIMLHIGACEVATCGVCRKLREIDHAHHASQPSPPANVALASVPIPQASSRSSCGPSSHGRVPIAPQPSVKAASAPASSPSLRPLASSKHVPIQPNLLPTASNPMGLLGAFPTFGFSLALYLEQTSATFRAEVKARVEKRVTAAAGQDLIQHMQKKTRLRSLDDLRADARTLVLSELERELHLHMQAYTWAANNAASGDALPPQLGGHECMLPPYLLSVAATGFAAFYAQQASFHAAVTGMTAAAAAPSTGAAATATPPLARRKASIGSAPSSAKASTTPLKAGISTATRPGKKAPDAAVAV